MSFISAIKQFDYENVWLVILAVIPYLDHEVVGIIPFLRDIVPTVDPIYTTRLSWTERGRLVALILVPYVDGEVLDLLFGVDVNQVISD